MKCIIPFLVKYSPIKKIAIIPFEKEPDKIYKGLELQYIDGEPYGNGYRIIAYRNDGYVDVYDDSSLKLQDKEKFNVAENGLNLHVQVSISNTYLDKINECEKISFGFKDIYDRQIDFIIEELSSKMTKPMNLLAPIGYGSKDPDYLPLFFLYNFDFVKRKKTKLECYIDKKRIKIDRFPLPMNMQFRYFARYSNNCEIIEFASFDSSKLLEVDILGKSYYDKNVEYIFESQNTLSEIVVHLEGEKLKINFIPSLNMNESMDGNFKICPRKEMGYLEGHFSVKREESKINIRMNPQSGWIPVPNSFITKMILKPKSVFCRWSKNYEYISEIDSIKKTICSKWKNNN